MWLAIYHKRKVWKKKQTLQSWHMQNLFGLNKRLVRLITHVLSLPKNVWQFFLLCCPAGSLIPGILQARTKEWVAISFSNAWKWEVKVKSLSCVQLLATPWTAAHQAPPSMGFSRQKYWSGVSLPSAYYAAVYRKAVLTSGNKLILVCIWIFFFLNTTNHLILIYIIY